MDAATIKVVQDVIRRESRSLLQYVSEAFPWTTAAEKEALAGIERIAHEETAATLGLVQTLARKKIRTSPSLGPYPMSFTSINYATLAYLLPLLIDYQKQAIADLAHDLVKIADADVAAQVEQIIAAKRKHLQSLIQMVGYVVPPDIR